MNEKERLQSLDIALTLLETLSTVEAGLGVSQLSQELGLSRPRVHRVLSTLHQRGYLAKNEASKYTIGPKIFDLGFGYLRTVDLQKACSSILKEIASHAQESAYLAILNQDAAVYIDRAESPNAWGLSIQVGLQNPHHCTAVGKVLMAFQAEPVIASVISKGLKRYTKSTITDGEALRSELSLIRQQGYGLDRGECWDELRCVAVPVRDHSGKVVAGIGIPAPASRLAPDRIESLIPFLKEMSSKASESLGYRPSLPTDRNSL